MNATITTTAGKVIEARIDSRGVAITAKGVLLGDVEDMERAGWTIAR